MHLRAALPVQSSRAVAIRQTSSLGSRLPWPLPAHPSRLQHRTHRLRGGPVRAVSLFGLFGQKSPNEKAFQEFKKSQQGAALEARLEGAGGDRSQLFAIGDVALAGVASANEGRLISTPVRVIVATVINRLIDIPVLNEAQEQVIFLKLTDVICDQMEKELHRMPKVQEFLAELNISDPVKKKQWRDKIVDNINKERPEERMEAVDLPLLNEQQEAVLIGFVVDMLINNLMRPY